MKSLVEESKDDSCEFQSELNIEGMDTPSIAAALSSSDENNQKSIVFQLNFEQIIAEEGLTDAVLHILSISVQFVDDKIDEILTDEMISFLFSRLDEEDVSNIVFKLCRKDRRFVDFASNTIETLDIDDVGIIFAYSMRFFDENMLKMFNAILSSKSEISMAAALNAVSALLIDGSMEQKKQISEAIIQNIEAIFQTDSLIVLKGFLECVDKINKKLFTPAFGEIIFKLMTTYKNLVPICSYIIADAGLEWKEIGNMTMSFFLDDVALEEESYEVKRAAYTIFKTFFNDGVPHEYYPKVLNVLFDLFDDARIKENAIKLATLILMADNGCVECFDSVIDDLVDAADHQRTQEAAMFLLEQIESIE